MARGGRRKTPSVDAGCGYKASISGGIVSIVPTVLGNKCNIEVGLGNATFKIDPTDPPDTIKRIITKDANGTYAPPLTYDYPRATKLFDSVEDASESFTDADGVVTDLTYKKLTGYEKEIKNYSESMGYIDIGHRGEKVLW